MIRQYTQSFHPHLLSIVIWPAEPYLESWTFTFVLKVDHSSRNKVQKKANQEILVIIFPIFPGSQRSIRKQMSSISRITEKYSKSYVQEFQDDTEIWTIMFPVCPGSQRTLGTKWSIITFSNNIYLMYWHIFILIQKLSLLSPWGGPIIPSCCFGGQILPRGWVWGLASIDEANWGLPWGFFVEPPFLRALDIKFD